MRSPILYAMSAAAWLGLQCGALRAEPIEDFYRGKTVTLYIGFSAGEGAYNLYGRFLAKYLGQFIPGNPTIQISQMPGAGTRTAGNYVANIAPQDGTAIALVDQALPFQQVLGEQMPFDTLKVNWIGNMVNSPNVLKTWTSSGVTSIEAAKKIETPLGGSGSGSSQQAKLMNAMLGTKFKIIQGYPSTEIDLALQRGEIWARTASWAATKATNQEWMREKKITILVQFGVAPAPELKDVPLLMDLAANDDDRTIFKLGTVSASIGKPLFAGPNVPPERVNALRRAFDATLADKTVLAEGDRIHLDLNPMRGEELTSIVADMHATPKPLRDRLSGLLGSIWD